MFVLTMNLNYETIILSTMLGSDKRAANFPTFSEEWFNDACLRAGYNKPEMLLVPIKSSWQSKEY